MDWNSIDYIPVEKTMISGSSLLYCYTRECGRKILHISGNGDMPNYGTWEYGSQWYGFSEVIVEEGVTSFGEYAFYEKKDLEKITLPSTLRYIGKHCFERCGKLKNIEWPDNVSEIKSSTFKDCSALERVLLPEGVTIIWRWAFQNCENLQKINIPSSIERISTTAFWGDDLNCLELSRCRYEVNDNCLYRENRLITAYNKLESVKIRPNTQVVADYAFYKNEVLKEVYCPPTLSHIERSAFTHCTELRTIYCQNTDLEIGENALRDCPVTIQQDKNKVYRLSMDTGQIAATRYGYALLRDGQVTCTSGCVKGDISSLIAYNDFVDIQGGFDFIVGLRKDGTVVCTKKESNNGDNSFPNSVQFPLGMKQISVEEGRVAGIDRNGFLFHRQADTFEQSGIQSPNIRPISVSVGYDTLLYIDQNNRINLLPSGDLKRKVEEKYNRISEKQGLTFNQCKIYNPYYCEPTFAIMSDTGRLFWSHFTSEPQEYPVQNIKKFAVSSGIVSVINENGQVFLQYRDGQMTQIPCQSKAVDIGLIHCEKLIILFDDGKDIVIDLTK